MAFVSDDQIRRMGTEMIKTYLFQIAMKSEWKEVVRTYRLNPKAHKAKITRTGDTALHIAVSDWQENHVEELVGLISNDMRKMKNERGNTPLHLAASMGNVRMCSCIAIHKTSLVGVPNDDNETPLFLAALHGKKDAFLCLHNIYINSSDGKQIRYNYCRRKDGDTILHCAISGDYFDLAVQIINLYGDLANSVNEQGVSPLHLLAAKPSAFKSGSHLSLTERIIYHCIYVDELRVDFNRGIIIKTFEEEKDPKYPENYQTCINFIRLFWNSIRVVMGNPNCQKADPESLVVPDSPKHQSFDSFPPNYRTCFEYFKLLLIVLTGLGSAEIRKIREMKQKHKWSVQIMNELLKRTSLYEYAYSGMEPERSKYEEEIHPYYEIEDVIMGRENIDDDNKDTKTDDKQKMVEGSSATQKKTPKPKKETTISIDAENGVTEMVEKILEFFPVAIHEHDMNTEKKSVYISIMGSSAAQKKTPKAKKETAILIAAKNGVTEMVEKILELFPVVIHDMNTEKKNIVLLAVENRQPHVYQLLLKKNLWKDSVFGKVDDEGNSALHLAAKLEEHKPWIISGAALQMQWEMKWFEFVKDSLPPNFVAVHNGKGQTPMDLFIESHKKIVNEGGKWLTKTSESCSVVAALITTVAFATSSTIPGGIKEDSGKPTFENQPAFDIFAIASLVALCFSVTALVMFLSILTRYQEKTFAKDLPKKLLLGMTSLFVSIASMLVSFCASHFFVLKDKLKYAVFPIYAFTGLSVTFAAVVQYPFYVELMRVTFKNIPQRSYKVASL